MYYIGRIPLAATGFVVGVFGLLFASQAQADLSGGQTAILAILTLFALALSTIVLLRGTE